MFFRTRYGTKVTIKSEAISNDYIEPYVPPTMNANLFILDQEDYSMAKELVTQVDGFLDLILGEWATDNYHHIVDS